MQKGHRNVILITFSLFMVACSTKITGGGFESNVGNEGFIFLFDKTRFIFKEKGSTTFLSEGSWTATREQISLTTGPSSKPENDKVVGDTAWMDLSGKCLKVLTKNKIKFDGVIYYRHKSN